MPKRITAAKTKQFAEDLGVSQASKRRNTLIEACSGALKSASEDALLAVHAILTGVDESSGPSPTFPRGVKCMGGGPPAGVPMFHVLHCLHLVTQKSKGELTKALTKEDRGKVFLYAVGMAPEHPIPEARMTYDDFYAWYQQQYTEFGSILDEVDFCDEEALDWCTRIGVLYLESTGDPEALDTVICRLDGERKPLPMNVKVPASLLGSTWFLEGNENFYTSKLVSEEGGFSCYLHKVFGKVTPLDI